MDKQASLAVPWLDAASLQSFSLWYPLSSSQSSTASQLISLFSKSVLSTALDAVINHALAKWSSMITSVAPSNTGVLALNPKISAAQPR